MRPGLYEKWGQPSYLRVIGLRIGISIGRRLILILGRNRWLLVSDGILMLRLGIWGKRAFCRADLRMYQIS